VTAAIAIAIVGILALIPKKKKNEPPMVGRFIPFFGAIVEFGMKPVDIIVETFERLGDCFTLCIFGTKMTFMVGPAAQAAFFRAPDDAVSPKEAYEMMIPVFGKNVVYDSTQARMYEQIRFISDNLSPNSLRAHVPVMTKVIKQFFRAEWNGDGKAGSTAVMNREALHELNRLTILTASRCLMGPEIYAEFLPETGELTRCLHDLEAGIHAVSLFFPNLPYWMFPSCRRRDEARTRIVEIFTSVVERRRREDRRGEDTLQNLMDAKYKDGDSLSPDEIGGLLIALLFAGQHTSSITSTWTLVFLLKHPEYLAEVMEEQEQVLGGRADLSKPGGGIDITYDDLKEMPKLENAVRETLRMYPPLIHLMRMVKKPIRYKNYTIPVGNLICVSPGASMRISNFWEDPDEWRPSRHNEKAEQFAYIPFGGGRHGCPGQVFGVQQVKTIMSEMLRHYSVELTDNTVPPPDYNALVVGPTPPIPMRLAAKDPKDTFKLVPLPKA
jgi:sterol 14-demethylase